MKLLLIGNHTCGNRGDAAILRGLIHAIQASWPDAKLTVTSRFPISSSYLLGRQLTEDPFAAWHHTQRSGLVRRLGAKLIPLMMMLALRKNWRWPTMLLPALFQLEMKQIDEYDAVIQVGGSFFVDLYGAGQYEYPFATLLANRPLFLIGHSLGPFESRLSRELVRTLLDRSNSIILREQVSRRLIEKYGLPMAHISDGTDCAWAVQPSSNSRPALRWLAERPTRRPLIAITVRELAPFDKRLKTTQKAYEAAFGHLINKLIECGYDVVAASTCTGIDGYFRDDRMNALRIGTLVEQPDHFHVVMDELDDVGLGELFSQCELLIGTRLHSAIISMNFGTPAIAIMYEHKSEGVMQQLGLPELSKSVQSLLDGTLTQHVQSLLPLLPSLRTTVADAVTRERKKVFSMIEECLADVTARNR